MGDLHFEDFKVPSTGTVTYDSMRAEIDGRFDAVNRGLRADQEARNKRFHQNLTAPQWIKISQGMDGDAWMRGVVKIIWSLAIEADEQPWLHVSVSRARRPEEPIILPSYFDMQRAKNIVVGKERFAYSVWAPTAEHVNLNPGVLHLFAPMGEAGLPLPDFTRGLATI